ncbi:hypothetical protein K2173_028288 [Erythroxylum novogranatense]|uniref:NAC domain-containing protein n=1 Tax=Erythroxylum novogranatense TaxID=1862640 RepID=A0AAV8U1F4_9ROSI|nr:hypothetical protein K2173_028288 [Erythroxylum novogranatense]
MEENLPPGFRFHPTDEELITFYLTRKVSDISFTSKAIIDVDLNKCEPWDLPGKASMGEREWYFFSMRDKKYPTGLRTNRATEAGYWKTTGKDKEIFRAGMLVGMKKTLVFYKGRAPRGEKSNWVMHEYRLENKHSLKPSKEEWVVCRVFQKSPAAKKPQQQALSPQETRGSPCDTNSILNEFADNELPNLNSIASSSSGFNNLCTATYNYENNVNMNNNMNFNMNWTAAREAAVANTLASLSWPSSLLGSNLTMNSLLLKALHRSYQQAEATDYSFMTDYSFLTQGTADQFGTDLSSNCQASPSKVLESLVSQPHQEQFFNVDSIW